MSERLQTRERGDLIEDWRGGGFGVYVHWPFCQAKCPYCDFNSHVTASVDHDRWRAALVAELAQMAARAPDRRAQTLFFGGGTPSLMPAQTVAAVIEAVDRLWGFAPDAEITLEANPTSVEAERFRGYAAAGVNRVSLGVQALNDPDLRRLGRLHTVAEARAAFEIARATFERVSFDLIYAREGQSLADWTAELDAALRMAVDHLSLYQLTIEPGTAFAARHAVRPLAVPADDLAAAMFETTAARCDAAGLPGYEVSNHARPGAESRHNLIYWRYGDYAGVGPGAHGRLTGPDGRRWTATLRAPGAWLAAVEAGGAAIEIDEALPPQAQAEEMLMMGLRLDEGVSLARFERLGGARAAAAAMARLAADGMVRLEGDRLRVTPMGRPVLNAVLRALLA